jgi:aminopeptidase N
MRRIAAVLCLLLGVSIARQGTTADLPAFGDPDVWHWAPSRTYHVENYRLAFHFDQARGEVFGDEVVTLKPFAPGFRRFYLDSSELSIDSVSLLPAHGKPVALSSDPEDPHLWITLDRDYGPTDRLKVHIVYHGFPRFGLFFENPDEIYPDRPREIWSQGEGEFNHHWFPCWDYPNDMATSETLTTVPEGQVVVSNGRLVGVTHKSGDVTYDWVESVPHSSYLTSLAIGPWQKVHDSYKGKPVDYYAPRGVDEATVRRVFHLTPDMLGFFSRVSIEYPYEQYAQVTVHDFVFGGMENVSATTLQEWVLQDAQAAIDHPATETIAHEMAQHWFGDYAQGRDWADIWLNEGFATYFPALYTQYHEGDDAYRLQMLGYQEQALAQDQHDYLRPIVDHHYRDAMDMFDQITHEKGAAVLDMMRYVLDGAESMSRPGRRQDRFFSALRHYLTTHPASATDTADLMKAVRDETGQDLDWFFHEWVFMAGTPAYRVTSSYDATTKLETVQVIQTQAGPGVPAVFEMPVELAFHGKHGEARQLRVWDDAASKTFTIPLDFEPLWLDFDPGDYIEKTLDLQQPVEALSAAVEHDPAMMARLWAARGLGARQGADADAAVTVLSRVLADDAFYGVRTAAAASLASLGTAPAKQALIGAFAQADSRVRAAAAQALGHWHGDEEAYRTLVGALQGDTSYAVREAAARSIGRSGLPEAFGMLQAQLATQPEIDVQMAVLDGMAATQAPEAVDVLLADAQPGKPIRLRRSALAGLAALQALVERDHAQAFAELVGKTLQDPYFPLHLTGEKLAASFHLTQFQPEIEDEAAHGPTPWQRGMARDVLKTLVPGDKPGSP